ncbi:MAG: hypothetical protein R3256_10155 [Thalassovita sp.]|nr:hypothetical protein [Thalassovita sp.]
MGVASVSAALAIGYVMQHESQPKMRLAQTAAKVAPVKDRIEIEEIALTAAPSTAPEIPVTVPVEEDAVALAAVTSQMDVVPVPAEESPALNQPAIVTTCEPEMTARAMPAAMVELSLAAACLPDRRVTIHHNGMMFTQVTDAEGMLRLQVPALSSSGVFIADFGDDLGAVAHSAVPDLAGYDRAVLQWRGNAGLHLHAMEFGAGFGEDGHIWADQPGSSDRALAGQGGFVTVLGDRGLIGGQRAEIYTFPSGQAPRDGDVVLSVDAEVKPANCQQQLEAEALQLTEGGGLEVRELVLSMPQCDAVGDFLVLKNLLQDLKVAAN